MIHLHGELTKVRTENCCNDRDGFSEAAVFDIGAEEIHVGDMAPNGAQLRPHIVWFGEAVPKIEAAIDAVEAADIVLMDDDPAKLATAMRISRKTMTIARQNREEEA